MEQYKFSDIEAYKAMCEYCSMRMKKSRSKKTEEKLTIKNLAQKAGVSETTINDFKRGQPISPSSFFYINEAFKILTNGESLYDYYLYIEKIMRGNDIPEKPDLFVSFSRNNCQIEPHSLKTLLEKYEINERGYLLLCLFYGADVGIVEVERNEDGEKEIYLYFLENGELKREWISTSAVGKKLKILSKSAYIYIGNPVGLSFAGVEVDIEDIKDYAGELYDVDSFNALVKNIDTLFYNFKKEAGYDG